jgi:uncharacterized SAM-binding protein YcdF (DUF218 family)
MLRQRGIGTAILVTSALHMPRARAQFEREGQRWSRSSEHAPGVR